ncbi:MAG: NAD(P)H-hydrate dehydratase [Gammaproteobacteria bacterium]|nr:NAD(P)H-hydrate dehydratase [Gammaproteobacteria bacterium]
MAGSENLYTAAQTRALDRCAIEEHGIPGITLMSRAAEATLRHLMSGWPDAQCLQILCGTGNNAGDGFLIADLAHKRGVAVRVLLVADAARLSGDAQLAYAQALTNGVSIEPYADHALEPHGVIVDALLGTGLSGEVRQDYQQAIAAINRQGLPVVAVDVPSGLCTDTGRVLGCAVRADLTVTFIGLKRGLFCLAAPDYTGDVVLSDLAVPMAVYDAVPADCQRVELEAVLQHLPARPATAHKGMYGSVLVIGGDRGMGGAVCMAVEGALRCGAGLVRAATRAEHVPAILARTPEAMAMGVQSAAEVTPLLEVCDVVVVGPGLGQGEWSRHLLQMALAAGKPLVVDADALNLLAADADAASYRDDWLLTPHPGEAARLLSCPVAQVQSDRFAAVAQLQQRYGGVSVLKGNGTLVATAQRCLLSDYGNPGMASGGMGDVLSGILGGLVAQGLSLQDAAALGVCVHGAAADLAAASGQRGLLATDLMPYLREILG